MRRASSTKQWLLETMRRRLGLTQVELSRASGVSQPFISMYENGRRDVEVGDAERLTEALISFAAAREMRRLARALAPKKKR